MGPLALIKSALIPTIASISGNRGVFMEVYGASFWKFMGEFLEVSGSFWNLPAALARGLFLWGFHWTPPRPAY